MVPIGSKFLALFLVFGDPSQKANSKCLFPSSHIREQQKEDEPEAKLVYNQV
jgi:hypothetical protein